MLAIVAATVGTVTFGVTRMRNAAPTVELTSVWTDVVRRGPMVREIDGPGALAPAHVRWVSAVVAARVEHILVVPGAEVTAETVLLSLLNPDHELALLDAQRLLAESSAAVASLASRQESERLAQQSAIATLRSEHENATRRAAADAALLEQGFLAPLEVQETAARASNLSERVSFELQRLAALTASMGEELVAAREQVERLRDVVAHKRREVEALQVRAGVDGILQELPLQPGQWVNPGTLLARIAGADALKAELQVAEALAKDVVVGQRVVVDTRNGKVAGRVARIDPTVQRGSVQVDVAFTEPLPAGTRPDMSVQGTIEFERLDDVLYLGRPAFAGAQSTVAMWRLSPDGTEAERVAVVLGRASARTIEVTRWLSVGDRVILSQLQQFDEEEHLRVR